MLYHATPTIGHPPKNNWHFVSIREGRDSTHLIWRNHAGFSWALYPTADPLTYRVGAECPYYQVGTTTMRVVVKGGVVHSVIGPHKEPFHRLHPQTSLSAPALPLAAAW